MSDPLDQLAAELELPTTAQPVDDPLDEMANNIFGDKAVYKPDPALSLKSIGKEVGGAFRSLKELSLVDPTSLILPAPGAGPRPGAPWLKLVGTQARFFGDLAQTASEELDYGGELLRFGQMHGQADPLTDFEKMFGKTLGASIYQKFARAAALGREMTDEEASLWYRRGMHLIVPGIGKLVKKTEAPIVKKQLAASGYGEKYRKAFHEHIKSLDAKPAPSTAESLLRNVQDWKEQTETAYGLKGRDLGIAQKKWYTPTKIAYAVETSVPYMGLIAVTSSAGGPGVGLAVSKQLMTAEAYESLREKGAAATTAREKAEVIGSISAISEALLPMGAARALKPAAPAFARLAISMGTEGLTEVLQETVQVVGEVETPQDAYPTIAQIVTNLDQQKGRIGEAGFHGFIIGGMFDGPALAAGAMAQHESPAKAAEIKANFIRNTTEKGATPEQAEQAAAVFEMAQLSDAAHAKATSGQPLSRKDVQGILPPNNSQSDRAAFVERVNTILAEAETLGQEIDNALQERETAEVPVQPEAVSGEAVRQAQPEVQEQVLPEAEVVQPKPQPYTYQPIDVTKSMPADKQWYHGTGDKLEQLRGARPSEFGDPRSLLGMGLYMSDNPNIGVSYERGRQGQGTGRVFQAQLSADTKLVNMEERVDPRIRDSINAYQESVYKGFAQKSEYEIPETATGMEAFRALQEALAEEGMSTADAAGILSELAAEWQGKGIDGLLYTGGIRAGGKGKHNAIVLLDNADLDPTGKIVSSSERFDLSQRIAQPEQQAEAVEAEPAPMPITEGGPVTQETPEQQAEAVEAEPLLEQPPVRVPEIQRKAVIKAFPGARITPQANGYNVELPNGASFNVEGVPAIDVDWDGLEQGLNRTFTPEQRADMEAAGSTLVTMQDGSQADLLTLVKIATEIDQDSVVRHEGLHVAKQLGMFNEKEWNALVKKYSSPDRTPSQQEEDIANARAAWAPKTGLLKQIKDLLNRIMSSLGLTNLDPDAVERMIESRGFWARRPGGKGGGGTGEGAQYSLRRRAELAQPGTTQAARREGEALDVLMEEEGYPQTLHDEDVMREANDLLEQDREGQIEQIVKIGNTPGGQLNPVQTAMAKQLFNELYSEAIKTDNTRMLSEAQRFFEAYRRTGTEQARAFRLRYDPMETPQQRRQRVLGEAILQPSRKASKDIDEALKRGDTAAADRLRQEMVDQYKRVKQALGTLGIDISDLDGVSRDRQKTMKAMAAIKSIRAGMDDMLYEYWQNAILAAPTTHIVNTLGNTGHISWHFAVERTADAVISDIARLAGAKLEKGARLGELKYVWRGLLPGVARGFRRGIMTWNSEVDQFAYETGQMGEGKFEEAGGAIPGRLGRIVRAFGYRPLLAMDAWAKSVVAEMEVGAQAYRIAKKERLAGDVLSRRMHDLMADMKSDAWVGALAKAEELSFQEAGGKAVQGIKTLREVPTIRYFIPFVKTPANIFRLGIRKSPLGVVALANEMVQARKSGDYSKVPTRAAEQFIAWGILLALLFSNDDDDPWLTGTQAAGGWRRGATVRGTGLPPPMSVKVGDTWYSYSRIEPFATSLGVIVDATEAYKNGSSFDTLASPVFSLAEQVKDKTWLKGIGDIMRITEADDPEQMVGNLGRWMSGFTASWVPNIYRSASRATREEATERGVWGKKKDLWQRILKRTIQKAEIPGVEDMPKIDLWGRPVKADGGSVLQTGFWWGVGVPLRTKREALHPGDRWLMNWNNTHVDEPNYPQPVQRYYRQNNETFYWTDQQYTKLAARAGTIFSDLVTEAVNTGGLTPEKPKEHELALFKKLMAASRRQARAEILSP